MPATKLKVLYLEDSEADLKYLEYVLQSFCTVLGCDSKQDFEKYLNDPFDIILLDFNLKGITGEEAIQMARRAQPDTPCILLTGSLGDDDAAAIAVKYGASCHFLKDRVKGLPQAIKAAHDVRQLKSQALRNDRLEILGNLSAGVVHDINNTLQVVLAGTELLRARVNPMDIRVLDAMERAAKRGAEMVVQILAFARGSNGGVFKAISVEYLFSEIGQILRSGAFPNIRSTLKVFPGTSKVLCDVTQLVQVALNLCVNSRDAMPNGGELYLTAQNVSTVDGEKFALEGKFILLSVKDSGTGISPEALPFIFDAFFSTKGHKEGTGMGLAIVKRIVDSHGGAIDVKSDSTGTTFNIYLLAAENGHTPHTRPHSKFDGEGKTILLAEDEETLRLYMQLQLEGVGYKVLTAANGPEALHFFRIGEHVDLLLSDFHMPVLGAEALIQNLHAMGVALPPVVIITGSDANTVTGMNAVLQKPFSEETLLETLDNVLKEQHK